MKPDHNSHARPLPILSQHWAYDGRLSRNNFLPSWLTPVDLVREYRGVLSCVRFMSARSQRLQKSKDGFPQVRTDLSKALWGRCVERFGLTRLTPTLQRFAAVIREMPAAICLAKSRSPRSCSQQSMSNLLNEGNHERITKSFHICGRRRR
jgi:hypothetical protein